jgi:hypothetical protein
MGSTGQQVVGAIAAGLMGIIVIAAIYQLNKQGSPLVPAASSSYQATLSSLFK